VQIATRPTWAFQILPPEGGCFWRKQPGSPGRGKLLHYFAINLGRSEEEKGSAFLALRIHWNCWGKLFPWKKFKLRHFRNVSVGNYAKIFNRSSSFIVRSSLFFDLQSVSTSNRAFQSIICTRCGRHLFCVLLFSFHLLSVPPFDVLRHLFKSFLA